ncbi:MAG: hypothetical protein KBT46_03020, partial [Ruminococcus sp.]|nr:hypothetical protein [Candidatus Copronaster equi]
MKKIIISVCAVLAIAAIVVIIAMPKNVNVDLGTSQIYSEEDRQSAIDIVKKEFTKFTGCKLFKLSYAGDEDSLKEKDYNENYDEAIVIDSEFLSPFFGGGSFNSHEIYTWHFILMRSNGGEWEILTYGYA